MAITNANKLISTTGISCGGTFQLTLTLAAEPTNVPADIVFLINRSSTMAGAPLEDIQSGVTAFLNTLDAVTGGETGELGSGTRAAIVSFADTATQNTPFLTSVAELSAATDALTAGGGANHADAFAAASALFDTASPNTKILFLLSDGNNTTGGDPAAAADFAKSLGITIYSIGVEGSAGLNEDALIAWSSDPQPAFVMLPTDGESIADRFERFAANLALAGATGITVTEELSPCFRIASLTAPTKGTANLIDANSLSWSIPSLGLGGSEGAVLVLSVEHVGSCTGEVEVNESVTYADTEGNAVTFPSPTLEVNCDIDVIPEGCPEPVDLTIDGCSDTVTFDAGDYFLESLGHVVQVSLTLRNICPNRRVALAVFLSEVDEEGGESQRGMKVLTIPAHTADGCRDVAVRCINFVVPVEQEGEIPVALCGERTFRARWIAHYIDSDFSCCDIEP